MSRVRVKFCGVRTADDARAAVAAGADAIGFNFHPRSPRFISVAKAIDVSDALPPFIDPIAVCVEQTAMEVEIVAATVGARFIQWHGMSRPPFKSEDYPLILAFRLGDESDLEAIRDGVRSVKPRAVLVDANLPGEYGGTGQTAPWHLLAGFDPGVPLILAGGLTPENVAEAIRVVRPYAVDVASGVESSPGVKDADTMRRFVDAVRSAV